MASARPLLHLIDGSGYIFRAYYAIRSLATAHGEPTNAVYGFTTMLQKALAEEKPTHLAIAFDTAKPTFRKEIYPDYKAHRPPPPEDLIPQFARIHEVVETFRIPTFRLEGWEADDLIATLTRRALEEGFDVRIITGDKDLMQLVTDRVALYDPMKDKHIGPAEVVERFGVLPEQVGEVLALAGDASDNIPGVRGVGEKTATKLLVEHGSLQKLMAAAKAGQIKGKVGQNIAQSEADIETSRRLVRLDDHAPVDVSLADLAYVGPDVPRQQALFEALEFRRLVLPGGVPGGAPAAEAAAPAAERFSFDGYRVIATKHDLTVLANELARAKSFAVALELEGPRVVDADVVGLAFASQPGEARYIPLRHSYLGVPHQLTLDAVLKVLAPALESREIGKVGVELKVVHQQLLRHGVQLRGLTIDAGLASYLVDPDDGPHDVRTIARRFLSHAPIAKEDLLGRGKAKRAFPELTVEEGMRFVGEQADIALRAVPVMEEMLAKAGVTALLSDLEMPLVPVLSRLELDGVKVDVERLTEMAGVFQEELLRLERVCFEAANKEFNLGSPKQLQKILFEELGLRIVKRTKTGPSTDASALEALVDEHPLPQAILDYRQVQKLKSTYVDALPRMVSPSTGRVHTVMNQTVAATGRLSSTDPNLQNIPIRTELGRQLRQAFIAEPGRLLISVDYSQIELRVLAHVSKDEVLTDAFKQGMDVHTRTAAALFAVDPKEVTPDQRAQAKTVNFGVLYGMGPVRLARQLGIPRRTASEFVEQYFARQPGVRRYIDETLEKAREEGFVHTLLGRRRRVADIQSKNRQLRAAAERIATNTPIQGTAADLIKLAMLRVSARLADEHPDVLLILQVHDELLLECPKDKVKPVAALVKQEMESAYPLDVPLVAEVHSGASWALAH